MECIESVLKSNYTNYQIIVVENGSENDSMLKLLSWVKGEIEIEYENETSYLNHLTSTKELRPLDFIYYSQNNLDKEIESYKENKTFAPIIFINSDSNHGFAAGNNIGIRYALKSNDFDYIWMLNNDTVIKNNTISLLVNYAEKYNVDITGSTLRYYSNPKKIQAYGGHINKFLGTDSHILEKNKIKEQLDYIIGAAFLIKKNVIDKIGLLPENYFLYFEETDYCFNAKKHGFKLDVCTRSIVYHKVGKSTSRNLNKTEQGERMDLLVLKNRIYFHKKYLGGGLGLYITLMIIIFNRLKRKQFKRIFKMMKVIFLNKLS